MGQKELCHFQWSRFVVIKGYGWTQMCLPSAWFFVIPKTINIQIYFLNSFGGPEKIVSFQWRRFVVIRDSVGLKCVCLAHSFLLFYLILSCQRFNWLIICRKTEQYSYLIALTTSETDQYVIWNSQLMTAFT